MSVSPRRHTDSPAIDSLQLSDWLASTAHFYESDREENSILQGAWPQQTVFLKILRFVALNS